MYPLGIATMDQLISIKNELIDKASIEYSDELDHDNDKELSKDVQQLVRDYLLVCGEIAIRESRMRRFVTIANSDKTVKDFYQDYDRTIGFDNDKWYSDHHDYHNDMYDVSVN